MSCSFTLQSLSFNSIERVVSSNQQKAPKHRHYISATASRRQSFFSLLCPKSLRKEGKGKKERKPPHKRKRSFLFKTLFFLLFLSLRHFSVRYEELFFSSSLFLALANRLEQNPCFWGCYYLNTINLPRQSSFLIPMVFLPVVGFLLEVHS